MSLSDEDRSGGPSTEADYTDKPRLRPYTIGADVMPGLSKVVEEMGELGQVLGKIMAVGGFEPHWDGSDLRAKFIEEAGDVLAAIKYLVQADMQDDPEDRERLMLEEAVEERARIKLETFWRWHDAAQPKPPPTWSCETCQDGYNDSAFTAPGGLCTACGQDEIPF